MTRQNSSGVGASGVLGAQIASKVARNNGITTRAQLDTFVNNGADAGEKALRRMATAWIVFANETESDFAAIVAAVTQ